MKVSETDPGLLGVFVLLVDLLEIVDARSSERMIEEDPDAALPHVEALEQRDVLHVEKAAGAPLDGLRRDQQQ